MIQDVTFHGLSVRPDDYKASDGDLDLSYNAIYEDDALRPILKANKICSLPANCEVIYIHKTAGFTHYIVQKESNEIYWFDAVETAGQTISTEDLNHIHSFTDSQSLPIGIRNVTSIGNTLIVLASDGIHYILWKGERPTEQGDDPGSIPEQGDDPGSIPEQGQSEQDEPSQQPYLYLGTHLPELPISFGIQGSAALSESLLLFDNEHPDPPSIFGEMDYPFSENNLPKFMEAINGVGNTYGDANAIDLNFDYDTSGGGGNYKKNYNAINSNTIAYVNKFIEQQSNHNGKFIFPFLVRYAYRLYDGSCTMQSAPVLMLTSAATCPQVFITNGEMESVNDDTGTILELLYAKVGAMVFDLDYRCIDENKLNKLKDWNDIVKSIDIFVSAPFYYYNQSGKVKGFIYKDSFSDEFTIAKTNVLDFDYHKSSIPQHLFGNNNLVPKVRVNLPVKTQKDFNDSIRDCSLFYLLKSIDLDELQTARTKIEIPEDYLKDLVTKERIEDDYESHDALIPSLSFVYNSRLNLADIKKQLADPFNPYAMVPYTHLFPINPNVSRNSDITIYVNIKQDGKEMVLKSPTTDILSGITPFIYFYYPNANATKATIVVESQSTNEKTYYEINLKKHLTLNGAVFFVGFNPALEASTEVTSDPSESSDRTVTMQNKLYTSEINNPFVFPTTGINTIGTGNIIGLSTAAKALSQGQFGQFPLYAFCTDGVWAMEVSPTGTFSAKQPISMDVCINPKSITQLDSSVVFASRRGIMLISGSETVCISENINTNYPFKLSQLPHIGQLELGIPSVSPFLIFIQRCGIIYDYIHQQIIIFNNKKRIDFDPGDIPDNPTNGSGQTTLVRDYPYAYVYSLKSKRWGMMESKIDSSINSYPEALAMEDGSLVSFSENTQIPFSSQLIVTRPLKLESGNTMKTINNIVIRGDFDDSHTQTILYGSRDLSHWYLVASSTDNRIYSLHGTPYKYFRIVVVAQLNDDESIDIASIEFTTKHTHRIS